MDFEAVWLQVLAELELQMDHSTFATWCRPTRAVAPSSNGVLRVAVPTDQVREWLEERLRGTIERTLVSVAGEGLAIEFVVAPLDEAHGREASGEGAGSFGGVTVAPPPSAFVVPEFDTHKAGWFPVAEYESRFWAPLLGRVAWRVWEIVRKEDTRKHKSEWTPARRWSAPALAAEVPCGKQALVGVRRKGVPQPGAFDRLAMEGVASVEAQGVWRHRMYVVSVRTKLPLLMPGQVGRLAERLQLEHDGWLAGQGLDPQQWWREANRCVYTD